MAVLLQLSVASATRDQFDALDAKVEQSMMEAGGPPAGLMAHVAYPGGDGFVLEDIWAMEAGGRAWLDDVLRPLLAEQGLTGGDVAVLPVWSFARP